MLVFGEPGLEKDNVAALVHFGAGRARGPLVEARFALLRFCAREGGGTGDGCNIGRGWRAQQDTVGRWGAHELSLHSLPTPLQHTTTHCHTHSLSHRQVDCANKPGESLLVELCGRGAREGLLHWVGSGTVILNNVHQAPPAALFQIGLLLAEGTYQPLPVSWTTLSR